MHAHGKIYDFSNRRFIEFFYLLRGSSVKIWIWISVTVDLLAILEEQVNTCFVTSHVFYVLQMGQAKLKVRFYLIYYVFRFMLNIDHTLTYRQVHKTELSGNLSDLSC